MNESPIRKFCESPKRKLIVVIATTIFALVVLIPLVDDYFDKKSSRSTLSDELDRARQTAKALAENEQEVAKVVEKLASIEARTISGDNLSSYRNEVMKMVRDSGCQMRQLEVALPSTRPWMEQDNPLESKKSKSSKNEKTPFSLERRNVVLLVDGSMENLRELMGQLREDDSVAYLHRMELQSKSPGSEQVTLKLELWLFALSRQKV